jgi:DNA modification methylase
MSKDSKKHDKIIGDDKPYDPSVIFDLFGYCKEILLFGADYYVDRLPNFGRDGSWIVWDKRVEEKYDKVIGSSYEMLWMKQKHRREILRYNYVSWQARMADGKKTHPTMKPVGLLSQVILKTIGESKLIADLFLGSGSTLIACEKTGRICYGMELDPKYVDVIVQRYVDFTGQENIKLNGEEIIWKKTEKKP